MPRLVESPDAIVERLLAVASSPSKRASLTTLTDAGEQSIAARSRPLRVAAYCRYSSVMQSDGYSIAMQQNALEQEAREQTRRGVRWEFDWFLEPAKSAKGERLEKRTEFLRMLRAAIAGEYDLVAVYKLDRFSRSEIVTLLALQELEHAGVGFISLRERFDVTTPSGWIALRFAISNAERENRDRGASISDGKQQRVMDGLYACRVPFGYRKDAEAVKRAMERMRDDPRGATKAIGQAPAERDIGATWEGLMRLYALMREGLTDGDIAETMNREGEWPAPVAPGGGKRANEARLWTRQTISWIRRNRFYRPFTAGDPNGTVMSRGKAYRGTHAAALSWDDWHALQREAGVRRRGWTGYSAGRRPEPYTAEFRGLAVCAECGGTLYVWRTVHDNAKTGHKAIYERYVCTASDRGVTCSQDRKWARVEDVRAAWVEWLASHPLDARWEELLRARAVQIARHGEAKPERVQDHAAHLAKLKRQAAAVKHLYAEGEMERADYERRRDAIASSLSRLESAGETAEQHAQRLTTAVRILQDAAQFWPRMTLAERMSVAEQIIKPHGLSLRLLAKKGYRNRWTDQSVLPPSCEIANVDPKPAYAEAIETVMRQEVAG